MTSKIRENYASQVTKEISGQDKIRFFQKFFQTGSDPVFLKTAMDKKVFGFMMPVSYFAIAGSIGLTMYIALGKMKK